MRNCVIITAARAREVRRVRSAIHASGATATNDSGHQSSGGNASANNSACSAANKHAFAKLYVRNESEDMGEEVGGQRSEVSDNAKMIADF